MESPSPSDEPTPGELEDPADELTQEEIDELFRSAGSAPEMRYLDPVGWEGIQDRKEDRKLRTAYAHRWFILVAVQLGLMNVLLILAGARCLAYSDWLFHAYLIGTLGECFGIVLVITRNLFPRRDGGPTDPRAN